MILRHVTLRKMLPSIIQCNALNAEAFIIRKEHIDGKYNAFEVNPTSNVLLRIFPIIKSNSFNNFSAEDIFELNFDGDRMIADGLVLEDLNQHKMQLRYLLKTGKLTEDELMTIGEFRFVRGEVSLDYLTSDCSRILNEVISGI
ncbi:MAG: hypothetical protein ACI8WT_003471 [Clostridium sp.]|jgi:hypothetical protein